MNARTTLKAAALALLWFALLVPDRAATAQSSEPDPAARLKQLQRQRVRMRDRGHPRRESPAPSGGALTGDQREDSAARPLQAYRARRRFDVDGFATSEWAGLRDEKVRRA